MNIESQGCAHYRNIVYDACALNPDAIAISVLRNDGTLSNTSYQQLRDAIDGFEQVFDDLGLTAGDRIGFLSKCTPHLFPAVTATICWNGTAVLFDPSIPDDELSTLIRKLDIRVIFTDTAQLNRLAEDIAECMPILDVSAPLASDRDLLGRTWPDGAPKRGVPDASVALILMSSGTTGSRSAIMIEHESLIGSAQELSRLGMMEEGKTALYLFPLFHIAGITVGNIHLFLGHTLCMLEEFVPARILDAIKVFQPYEFYMIPQIIDVLIRRMEAEINAKPPVRAYYHRARRLAQRALVKHGDRSVGYRLLAPFRTKIFGPNIRLIASGGAAISPETGKAILDMGIYWANVYASTEAGVPISVSTPAGIYDYYSAGMAGRVRGVELKINNPDENGIGEVYVKTAFIMKGYYNDPQATADAFDGEWFKTGDMGYLRPDKRLMLTGRVKESIVLKNGKKFAPADLEKLLMHFCTKDNPPIVVGVPMADCPEYDEVHVFFLRQGMSDEEVTAFENDVINCGRDWAWAYPINQVHCVDAIPLTTLQKPKRYLLKEQVIAEREQRTGRRQEASGNVCPPNTLEAAIADIIQRVSNTTRPIYRDSRVCEDLGLDSLACFEICSAIEQQFGVFPDKAGMPNATVADFAQLTQELMDQKGSANTVTPSKSEAGTYLNAPIHRNKRTPDKGSRLLDVGCRIIKPLYHYQYTGLENLKIEGPCIFACNHQGFFDPAFIGRALKAGGVDLRKVGYIVYEDALHMPVVGPLISNGNAISTDFRHGHTDMLRECESWIAAGGSLLIFPEGERSHDGHMHPFRVGGAYVACAQNVPIVPIHLNGSYDSFSVYDTFPKLRTTSGNRYTISVTICPAVYPEGKTPEQMTAQVFESVAQVEEHAFGKRVIRS